MADTITTSSFGWIDNQEVTLYTLINSRGMKVEVLNYGGIVKSVFVPDKNGDLGDVVLGFDDLDSYLEDDASFGAFVGRYANRITNAQFTLDGQTYYLAQNIGKNTLHGGRIGFAKKYWNAVTNQTEDGVSVTVYGRSVDGDESFPGNLDIKVHYLLNNDNELHIDYHAVTDKPTVINLTNHMYFNLRGQGQGDILDHLIQIYSNDVLEVNEDVVPTGIFRPVANTPLDFNNSTRIGDNIYNESYDLIKLARGYDHTFRLDPKDTLKTAANVVEPFSGRTLTVFTEEPALHLYCANQIDVPNGKNGHHYKHKSAFCLETQHFADSPNQPHFPSTRLDPGQVFTSKTVYRFGVVK